MSLNNIMLTAENDPVQRYATTVRSKISGERLDPLNGRPITFILSSSSDDFLYEDDVIEIYSDKEHRFFQQANRLFFTNGYLKPYNASAPPLSMANILSDEEVERLASTRTIPAMKKALSLVNSRVSLDRILEMARYIGRPQSVLNLIEDRIKEL